VKSNFISNSLALSIFCAAILTNTHASFGQALIRIKPSTPKELLVEIYNYSLTGHDRLSDIENYMSAGLKSDYKKALKSVRKCKKCDVPRILSNGIFSDKLKGFNVETVLEKGWNVEAKVILDTGANNLPADSPLKKFDPKIYEVISFTFVKRFIDWKIDNIKASEPDVEHVTTGINYKNMDLRELLKACK
jgi:hypothetical protein